MNTWQQHIYQRKRAQIAAGYRAVHQKYERRRLAQYVSLGFAASFALGMVFGGLVHGGF